MLQEIAEQPAALRATIDAERAKIARLGSFLRQREIDLIVLVARGSSDNAALFGRYLIEIATGIPVSLAAPSVHRAYQAKLNLPAALADGEWARLDYDAIPDMAARALELKPQIEQLVERYVFMENCVVVGRGLLYANAYELALKLMETCYVVAERFSSADFLHGPLAMVERHFPVVIFAAPGVALENTRTLLARLNELRADTL